MIMRVLLCFLFSLTGLSAQTLTISSHFPTRNAVDVTADGNITITFSASDMNQGACNAHTTFNVDGSLSGEHLGSFSGHNTSTLTFDPTNDFEASEVVTVTLTTVIQTISGNALASAYTFQFIVRVESGSGAYYDSGNTLSSTTSRDISMGDLDGDGDPDAFEVNSGADRVWINDGNGIFTNSQSLGSSSSHGVSLGDLDGDGDLDAFVVTSSYNKVWINQGGNQAGTAGNFLDSGQNIGGYSSEDVALGDVDGDGDLDAYEAIFGGNRVWINNGSGTFTNSGQILSSGWSRGVSMGDLDGDGDLDAFVSNGDSQGNRVWLNDGSGNFSDSGQDLGSSDSRGVSLGDVDDDGDLDAFVSNGGSQGNRVWLNDGSGNFSDSGQDLGSSNSHDVALGDVDNDGDLDVYVANPSQANTVWLNNGSGIFTDSGNSLGSSVSIGVSLADVDNDGDLDAFVANYNQENKVWLNEILLVNSHAPLKNTLDRAANSSVSVTFNENINESSLDDDANFNVIGALSGRHQGSFSGGGTSTISFDPTNNFEYGEVVTVTLTTGIESSIGTPLDSPQTFQFFVEAPNGCAIFYDNGNSLGNFNSQGVALGDVDGDNDLDAFVINGSQPDKVWINNSSANFTDSGNSLGSEDGRGVALGDLDGDGDLDAFVANYLSGNKVWTNDGSGNFSDSGNSLGTPASMGVALGDVDGDGDLDAFVTIWNGGNIVYLNNGSGSFTDSGQSLGSSLSFGVSLGDVDNDGDLDAFVVNWGQGNTVWLNNGSGNYTNSINSLGSAKSRGVTLGDVDADGDMDACVANADGEANKVWINNSSGIFTDSGNNLGSANSYRTVLSDLDNDGDLDLFVANQVNNKVYLNSSDTFTDNGNSLGSTPSTGAALGDLDGDGDLDAFAVNSGWGNKVWSSHYSYVVRFQAKVFLEGPYNDISNEMITSINSNIPLTSPYSEHPRTVSSIPSTITDWVLVKLILPGEGDIMDLKSAFLRNDGKIVADDGITEYIFMDTYPGDYLIVIKHRNHLAVMSDDLHTFSAGSSTLYDFTTGTPNALVKYEGGEAAELETGIYGMFSGDADGSGTVDANDRSAAWNNRNTSGYLSSDCCLSGTCDANSRSATWNNRNKSTQVLQQENAE